ncbi:MAG: ABC transporter permease [Streptosporangiaceae bacterium]|jgi:ABC-2 type transport system permease protein
MTATMVARCVRLSSRQTDSLITSLTLPVLLMVTFVYLFGGAIETGTPYITYVVPGVLLLCAAVGSATTAVTVSQDLKGGIIDRFRSMDVRGITILSGHVAASIARNLFSSVLVMGIALAIGFRPHGSVIGWLAALAVLLMFVIAVSWLSAAFGLLVTSPDAANSIMFVLMFLTYASSAFVPVRTMPWWLHGFAYNQPATPVIETLRGLLSGTSGTASHAALAVAWCVGITAASILASSLLWNVRTRRLSTSVG